MRRFQFILFLGFILTMTSCASLNQSLNFEEDDVYYSNDFQHRFNYQSLLMNKDVAMPDSAYSYFDETYAESIRPSYANRINKFDENSDSEQYVESQSEEDYFNQEETVKQDRWMSCISIGFGMAGYYGNNAYYGGGGANPYYSSYNSQPTYYGGNYSQRAYYSSPVSVPREYYTPFVPRGNNRSNSTNTNTRTTPNRTVYKSPTPSYGGSDGNVNRQYKTRGGGYTTPSYGPGSRSGGSSGTVGGYRRR